MGVRFYKCCQRVSGRAEDERCVDCIESDRAKSVASAVAAERARIAAAIREEYRRSSGRCDESNDILARLLRVVEGG